MYSEFNWNCSRNGQGDQRSKVDFGKKCSQAYFWIDQKYSLSFIEIVNNNLSNGLLPILSSVSRVEETDKIWLWNL